MKIKKYLASAAALLTAASMIASQAGAIQLGRSECTSEFWFVAADMSTKEIVNYIFMPSLGGVFITAYLECDAMEEDGLYTFVAEPAEDFDYLEMTHEKLSDAYGEEYGVDAVDLSFYNDKYEQVSAKCRFGFVFDSKRTDADDFFNCAFVYEGDELVPIPLYITGINSFMIEAPHCSRFVFARLKNPPVPAPVGEQESSEDQSYIEIITPESEIGPPIVSYPDEEQDSMNEPSLPKPDDKGADTGDSSGLTVVFAAAAMVSVGIAAIAGKRRSRSGK